eukprot:CAMPEP_0117442868 /NCGR_PEP_ID=MMETSP0759-20121206/4385_1 /TAXON_ID=63605 /ORGANISM="Percolomonas cosmopolitus, Strain WS" /LENGTH=2288 /DNA_ID=CAMNT_0005234793 /DNA_START=233 /DNA_END=7099 /DNA_ORIENTATION=+
MSLFLTLIVFTLLIVLSYNILLYLLKSYLLSSLNSRKYINVSFSSFGAILYLLRHASVEVFEDVDRIGGCDVLKEVGAPLSESEASHRKLKLRMKLGKMRLVLFRRGRWLSLYVDDIHVDQWVNKTSRQTKRGAVNGKKTVPGKSSTDERAEDIIRFPSYVEKWIAPYVHVVCRRFTYTMHNDLKSSILMSGEYVHLRLDTGGHATKLPTKLRLRDLQISIHREYHSKKELLPVLKMDSMDVHGILETQSGIHASVGLDVDTLNFFWSPSISSALKHFSEKSDHKHMPSGSPSAMNPQRHDYHHDEEHNVAQAQKSLKKTLEKIPISFLIKSSLNAANIQVEAYDKYSPLYARLDKLTLEAESKNISDQATISLNLQQLDCEAGRDISENSLCMIRSCNTSLTASILEHGLYLETKTNIHKLHGHSSPSRIQWIKRVVKFMKEKKIVKNNHMNLDTTHSASPTHSIPSPFSSSTSDSMHKFSANFPTNTTKTPISVNMKSSIVVDHFNTHFCDDEDQMLISLSTEGWNTSLTLDRSLSASTGLTETTSEVQLLLGKFLISLRGHSERTEALDEIDTKTLCHIGDHPVAFSACKFTISNTSAATKMHVDLDHVLVGLAPHFPDEIVNAVACYSPLWKKPNSKPDHLIIIKNKKPKKPVHVKIQISSLHVFGVSSEYLLLSQFNAFRCLIDEKVALLAETNKTVVNTLLKTGATKKFDIVSLHKVAYMIDKTVGMQISSSSLRVDWNIPAHLRTMAFVKSIIHLVKGIKNVNRSNGSASPPPVNTDNGATVRKKKKPLSLKIHKIQLCGTFTPEASLSLTIHSAATKDIMDKPISISNIKFFVCAAQFAHVRSVTLHLKKHPLVQRASNSFLELHREATHDKKVADPPHVRANFYMTINVVKPEVTIPHHYPLGNVVNEIKNAKKVLIPRKSHPEGFNRGRPLPALPRAYVTVSDLSVEMADNVVEQALMVHQYLWKKEAQEREVRENELQKKIQAGAIPEGKIEEIKERLRNKNSQEYMRRIEEFLKKNTGKGLLNIHVKSTTCDSYRHPRLKTYDDVIEMMKQIDKPPFPEENGVVKDFGLLAAMTMTGTARGVDVSCRNHPYSMFQADSVTFSMTLMPMFVHGTPGVNTVMKRVDVGLGEAQWIPASLTGGMRIFLDGNAEMTGATVLNGPMYHPIITDLLQFIKKLIPRSGTNPSPRLRWWDKVRLLLHGSMKLQIRNLNVKIVTGVDPYDQTDSLEIDVQHMMAQYKARDIHAIVNGINVTYNPSLVDFPLASIPEVHLKMSFQFENNMKNPYDYFFPTQTPADMKTVDDVPRFKGMFDLYKDWRITAYTAQLNVELYRGAMGGASCADTTIMFNPIACSWFIEFFRFMSKKSFQVGATKNRFGVVRSQDPSLSLSDFKKSFDMDIKVHGLNIIWSNSYQQNNILQLSTSQLRYIKKEHRDVLPDITRQKYEREKAPFQLLEHSVEATDFVAQVHSYDLTSGSLYKFSRRHSFLGDHMLSITKLIYKMNDPKDIFPEPLRVMRDYKTYMMAYDLHVIWTSALRDALFQWIDLVQQFIFTTKNVVGNRAGKMARSLPDYEVFSTDEDSPATPLGEKGMDLVEDLLTNPKQGHVYTPQDEKHDYFMAIGLIRPKYGLYGDENSEVLMFQSPHGTLLFQNITQFDTSDSSSSLKRSSRRSWSSSKSQDSKETLQMTLLVTLPNTTCFWIDSSKLHHLSQIWSLLKPRKEDNPFPIGIDSCDIAIRYIEGKGGQIPRKQLNIDFPELNLHFSSTQIRAFIDIITNVLVPKKKGSKIVLEDQKQTFLLMGKLAPDQWENIRELKQRCKSMRTEIRSLIFQIHQKQRAFRAGDKDALREIQSLEAIVDTQKSKFHALKEALQRAASRALDQEKDTSCLPDFKIDLTFFNVGLHLRDLQNKIFLVANLIHFKGRIVKNTDYSTHHTFSVHEIKAMNHLPNPIYTTLIETLSGENLQTESDQCLEITVNKSPPVAGMQGFDHFQISLSPIAFRFTYEVYKKIWAFLFPHIKTGEDEDAPVDKKKKGKVINKEELQEAISDSFLKGYVDTMKSRAAQRKIFKYIRFDEAELYVSFRGTTEERTPALMNFVSSFDETRVHIRPLTYNSETWSWTELAERLKRDIALEALQHVLPQTVKSLGMNKVRHVQDWLKSTLKLPNNARTMEDAQALDLTAAALNFRHSYQQKLNHQLVTQQQKVLKKTGEVRHHDSLKSMLLLGNTGMPLAGRQLLGNEYKQNSQTGIDTVDVEREDQALDENLFDELLRSEEGTEEEEK